VLRVRALQLAAIAERVAEHVAGRGTEHNGAECVSERDWRLAVADRVSAGTVAHDH
jgi:hypothetical protein